MLDAIMEDQKQFLCVPFAVWNCWNNKNFKNIYLLKCGVQSHTLRIKFSKNIGTTEKLQKARNCSQTITFYGAFPRYTLSAGCEKAG